MSFVVAIDGPAGSGKGTITKLVGEKLGLVVIDTGAMYRCVALKLIKNNVKPSEIDKIKELLVDISVELERKDGKQIVLLDGVDVSKEIRTPKVDKQVGDFSSVQIIRDKMTPLQRKMGEKQNIIMDGRDIGTVVFPNADVKIYLDASTEERAKRRYKQDIEKKINITYEDVLETIKKRDKEETEREIAPLRKADDAIYIDSTNMTIDEVVDKIIKIIKDKNN